MLLVQPQLLRALRTLRCSQGSNLPQSQRLRSRKHIGFASSIVAVFLAAIAT